MRRSDARLSTRRIIALIAVPALPLGFWAWRIRSGFPFPGRFDLVPIGVSIVALAQVASLWFERLRLRTIVCGLGVLNFVALVWFTSVEWHWIQLDCPRCDHVRWVEESQIFWSERRRPVPPGSSTTPSPD